MPSSTSSSRSLLENWGGRANSACAVQSRSDDESQQRYGEEERRTINRAITTRPKGYGVTGPSPLLALLCVALAMPVSRRLGSDL